MSSPCPSSSSPLLASIASSLHSPSRDALQQPLLNRQPAPVRPRPREERSVCARPEKSVKGITQARAPPLQVVPVFVREEEEPSTKRHHAEPESSPGRDSSSGSVSRSAVETAVVISAPLLSLSSTSSWAAPSSFRSLCTFTGECPVVGTWGARARLPDSPRSNHSGSNIASRSLSTASTHPMVNSTAADVLSSPSLGVAPPSLSATCSSIVSAYHGPRVVCSHPPPASASTVPVVLTEASTPLPVSSLPHRIRQHELRPADFRREEVLGEGSYSIVTLATHRASGLFFALKEIDRSRLRWRPLEAQLRWEINLQRTLRHPHIVRLYSYFITPDCINLVLEYCSGGTLLSRLRAAPQHRLSEGQASRYTRHVAKALVHLHELGVAHRDLKLENVLIDADGIAKLADFGWSRPVVHPLPSSGSAAPVRTAYDRKDAPLNGAEHDTSSEDPTERAAEGRRTVCGTLDYLSPEMVSGQAHSAKTDVWSLGVMLAEMLTGTPPFYTESTHQTLHAIQRLPPNLSASHPTRRGPVARGSGTTATADASLTLHEPVALSAGALSLIHAMLQKDPAARPTMSEVLSHPWLQKLVRKS
ncbi:serine/threonine-protein kinase, putative [Leishmania guyanensis]